MISGTIRLPDDSIEFIRSSDDFAFVVRERLGYDAEQMVLQLVGMADLSAQSLESDLRSYEMSLERVRSSISEVGVLIEQLRESLINRPKLLRVLDRIEMELSNHL